MGKRVPGIVRSGPVAHIRAGMLVTLCKIKLLTQLPEVNV